MLPASVADIRIIIKIYYTGDNSKSPAEPKRSITAEQFEYRMILRRAMLAHAFKPLDSEWWQLSKSAIPYVCAYLMKLVQTGRSF